MNPLIPFLITPKDIMLLNEGMSLRTAQREHKYIRDILKLKRKRLTFREYCEYWGDDYETLGEILLKKRSQKE